MLNIVELSVISSVAYLNTALNTPLNSTLDTLISISQISTFIMYVLPIFLVILYAAQRII